MRCGESQHRVAWRKRVSCVVLNEVWREPEDRVAWRQRVSRVVLNEVWREPEDRVAWRQRVSRVVPTDQMVYGVHLRLKKIWMS